MCNISQFLTGYEYTKRHTYFQTTTKKKDVSRFGEQHFVLSSCFYIFIANTKILRVL